MANTALEVIKTFTEDTLPDLDVVTEAALELFSTTKPPSLGLSRFSRPLVLGSGNALVAAKAIFANSSAVFADESSYEAALFSDVDGAYIFSASGGKHAVTFAKALQERGIPTVLITNNAKPEASRVVSGLEVIVFPKNREPYTYNTSTYMGMFLAATSEESKPIVDFIHAEVAPLIPDTIGDYDAYYVLLPERFAPLSAMFVTKFDELFGPKVLGRVFTYEQTKHAKTVVESDKELFISFGVENAVFGKHKLHIPLPDSCYYATMMAIGYYVIGNIQKHKEPFFKQSIARYMKEASALFGEDLAVIVE